MAQQCSECAAGETYNVPAKFLIKGTDNYRHDKPVPFKKWVCEDHFEMFSTECSNITILKTEVGDK